MNSTRSAITKRRPTELILACQIARNALIKEPKLVQVSQILARFSPALAQEDNSFEHTKL